MAKRSGTENSKKKQKKGKDKQSVYVLDQEERYVPPTTGLGSMRIEATRESGMMM